MNSLKCLVLSLACFAAGCADKSPTPSSFGGVPVVLDEKEGYRCESAYVIDGELLKSTICFCDHFAVEFDPAEVRSVSTVYNLHTMSWTDVEPRQTVSIKECESWAEASVEKSRQSLAKSSDKNLNRFVELTLNPRFSISDEPDGISLKNDVLTYHITNPISLDGPQLKRFFAYDRLNAYRKSMNERKSPPFPQLAVAAELERRNVLPGIIDLEIRTPNNRELKLRVTFTIAKMTESETIDVRNAIRDVTGTTGPSIAPESQ